MLTVKLVAISDLKTSGIGTKDQWRNYKALCHRHLTNPNDELNKFANEKFGDHVVHVQNGSAVAVSSLVTVGSRSVFYNPFTRALHSYVSMNDTPQVELESLEDGTIFRTLVANAGHSALMMNAYRKASESSGPNRPGNAEGLKPDASQPMAKVSHRLGSIAP